jgi:hypothetical protein
MKKPTNVTRLDDAKALRAMGAPMNQPVIDIEISSQATKTIIAVHKATRAFGNAVVSWVKKQKEKRFAAKRSAKVIQTWNELDKALSQADKWIEKSRNEAEAIFVTEYIVGCRAICEQWDEILTVGGVFHVGEGGKTDAPWPIGKFPDQRLIHDY